MRDGPLALFRSCPSGVPNTHSPSPKQWNPGDQSLEDGWWHVRMDWCGKDTVGCDRKAQSPDFAQKGGAEAHLGDGKREEL